MGNMLLGVLMIMSGIFGIMLSFYLVLCFIQWVDDVYTEKRWLAWKEWIR